MLDGFLTTGDPSALPSYWLTPRQLFAGVNHPADEAESMRHATFEETFSSPHADDAHYVGYRSTVEMPNFPRCNKPILLHMRNAGIDLLTHTFSFDLDSPGHEPWTPETLQRALDLLQSASEVGCRASMGWTACYAGRAGLRLVYVLAEPLPVDVAEPKHRWMCDQLIQVLDGKGVKIDRLSDWTRLMRVPKATRDGRQLADSPLFLSYIQPENRLDAKNMPSMEGKDDPRRAYANVTEVDCERPDDEDAKRLVWQPVGGSKAAEDAVADVGGKLTDYGKAVKKRLLGRDSSDAIFKSAPLCGPERGQRDSTIHARVGEVVGLLAGFDPDTTPAHVYGLFLPAVSQFNRDQDWPTVLWDAICRLWSKQMAKVEAERDQMASQAVEAKKGQDAVVEGMRGWCDHPELHKTSEHDAIAKSFMLRRAIATKKNSHYLLLPNGTYDGEAVSEKQLIPHIRTNGLEWLIQTTKMTDAGIKDRTTTEILNEHSFNVREVEVICPNENKGGIVPEMKLGGQLTLQIPGFELRDDLTPTWNKDVDDWMRAVFGDFYEVACAWFAGALEFQYPIAALSIVAGEGIGKKMIMRGLSECLKRPVYARAETMTSDYQTGLDRTPFLLVNEGWPVGSMKKQPSTVFRELTGGDGVPMNEKYEHMRLVKVPTRILFTANNEDVIERVIASKSLSPEDQEALGARVLHMDLTKLKGGQWLREKGGHRFTGSPGKRWVAPDGGGQSNFILAKHIMFLHQNNCPKMDGRFIVRGNYDQRLINKMRTQAGQAPVVVEALLRMMELSALPEMMSFVDGEMYVTIQAIADFARQMQGMQREDQVTIKGVGAAIRSLIKHTPEDAFVLKGKEALERKYWHILDLDLLSQVADQRGFASKRLAKFVKDQRAYYSANGIVPEKRH